jgi:hypothetical protein
MRRKRWLTAGLALALGGGTAALIPVLPAVGQSSPPSSPIVLAHTATLADKGAVVNTTTMVACGAGDFGQLAVSLSEKAGGNNVAAGAGIQLFNCTGQIQRVKVPVAAGGLLGAGKVFTTGTAFEQATLLDCPPFVPFCNQSSASRSVMLTKK